MNMRNLLFALLIACHLPPPMTPKTAEASTYTVFDSDYAGTAWVVAPHTLVTAGHMCVRFARDQEQGYARSSAGHFFPVSTAQFEMSSDESADLCVLTTEIDLAPPLTLAYAMPLTGDSVGFVGKTTGTSAGEFRWPDFSTAPCGHGDSGAALYYAAGVWGVLVQSPEDDLSGASGCLATTLPELGRFLRSSHVSYVIAPEPLPE